MRVLFWISIILFLTRCGQPDQVDHEVVQESQVIIWNAFPSEYVERRNIEILLPKGYSDNRQYPVVYMMDGQNLFSVDGSHWGKSWEIDNSLDSLPTDDPLLDMIIVGIHSIPTRFLEYCPQKPVLTLPLDSIRIWRGGLDPQKVFSDSFLQFLVTELKPTIDNSLSTASDRNNTFIAGSSMGGLISLYASLEYPEVFSGAACISTHWPLRLDSDSKLFPNAMISYISSKLDSIQLKPRFYFDCGTTTLDRHYPKHQSRVDSVFRTRGYNSSNFQSLIFKGAEHDEIAWRSRNRSLEALRFARGLN